jgi:hypothetical protein
MAFPGGVPAHRRLRDLFIIRELLLQYLLSSIFVSSVTSVYAFFNRTVEIMFDVNSWILKLFKKGNCTYSFIDLLSFFKFSIHPLCFSISFLKNGFGFS